MLLISVAEAKELIPSLLHGLGFNLLLLVKILLILFGSFLLERGIYYVLRRTFKRNPDPTSEDRTRYRFLRNATRFIVGVIAIGAIVYSIPSFKSLAITLFAGAGILVAILGLATQRAFSNIISGIFIVGFKPFRVGDMLDVAGQRGIVEDITLRHTVIVSFENRRIIIPNALISDETIVNSTINDPATCEWVEMSISYESDVDKAIHIMQTEAVAHPHCIDKRSAKDIQAGEPQVAVRLVNIADSGLVLRAYVWGSDPVVARLMHFDLNRSIKLHFDRAGIEIPYPHRTITFKGAAPDLSVRSHEKGS